MTLTYLLILALVQGITEFLPVSSSAHLILLPALSGAEDQGLALDVAVHVGTLGAVILYFRRDVALALRGTVRLMQGRVDTGPAFFALCLLIATIPVMVAGLAIKLMGWDEALRSTAVIGWTMIVFGLVLWWADTQTPQDRDAGRWTLRDATLMGLAQALALIPGTSRSGITITAARALGYDRAGAARLAMVMSVPTIIASGVLLGADAAREADFETLRLGAIAALFAFAAALAALWGMMRLLRHVSFTPYVVYRVLLGGYLLWIAYI